MGINQGEVVSLALKRCKDLIRDTEAKFGTNHTETLKAKVGLMNELCQYCQHLYHDSEFWKLHDEIIAGHVQTFGPDHPATMTEKISLAVSLSKWGKLEDLTKVHQIIEDVIAVVPQPVRTSEKILSIKQDLASTKSELESMPDWMNTSPFSRGTVNVRWILQNAADGHHESHKPPGLNLPEIKQVLTNAGLSTDGNGGSVRARLKEYLDSKLMSQESIDHLLKELLHEVDPQETRSASWSTYGTQSLSDPRRCDEILALCAQMEDLTH